MTAGTRRGPLEDGRFFKEHLDELDHTVVDEVRRRNRKYVEWLADNLMQ